MKTTFKTIKQNLYNHNLLAVLFFLLCSLLFSQSNSILISKSPIDHSFQLFSANNITPILFSSEDYLATNYASENLQQDLLAVSGKKPALYINKFGEAGSLIISGTIGLNPFIDKLIDNKRFDASKIKGKREFFLIQVIDNPMKDIEKALIIAGSDKRGTVFGIYHMSEMLGVSPWYWWADVPIQKKGTVYITGKYISKEPKVEYRGIFINDEAPALTGWVNEKFGGFNAQFYKNVFELILRLKGNFLWPAMWGSAFYADDPNNGILADEYGVVIGTSHHEPMLRAHAEWKGYGTGPWDYSKNADELKKFWVESISERISYENIVTVGMRGDGDEAMSEGTAIDLLEKIVRDQRKILEDVTGKSTESIPQVWALYKEVQDYYDKGMRVPEDITLLLCDDNWGNIRILPKKEEFDRKGGFGIYYHFDFVGSPVSYRWLNVTQIEKVWEQMNLAYQWGARKLWLVNVGDIKPMELPINFFLDFAFDPENFTPDKLPDYYTLWAKQQFGEEYSREIGEILSLYTKYNARRTPEMLKPNTYSLFNYNEAETIVNNYNSLVQKSKQIYSVLPKERKAAFYQLVLFPVEICANLYEMYVLAGKNMLYAKQDRASTNMYAEKVKTLYKNDKTLTDYYHTRLSNGKWNHFMSQTHIGYTSWNNPEINIMPEIEENDPGKEAELGILIEGSDESGDGQLPEFDPNNDQQFYIEIFNKGLENLTYTIETGDTWIIPSSKSGSIKLEDRVNIKIDWEEAPKGKHIGEVTVRGAGNSISVEVPINNRKITGNGFIENNGVISINASNYSKVVNTDKVKWEIVPNLGRTESAVVVSPSNSASQTPGGNSPYLEYNFSVFEGGNYNVHVYISPTLNFMKNEGLKYALSINNETPQIINIHQGENEPDWKYPRW